MARSHKLLTSAAVVTGIAALMWSFTTWQSARARAESAATDLATCKTMERQITTLRDQPRLAQAAALQQPDMARRIEKGAREAGIDPSNIERIAPDEPRRLGDTVYLDSPIQITLAHVNMSQLVALLHGLSANTGLAGSELRIQSIRLGAPRSGAADNSWRAEIVVSYLVYSPKNSFNTTKD
jgi:type II secretory pathway component PulM